MNLVPGLIILQEAAPDGSPFGMLIPMAAIFGIFYFLLIRPQQKKMKAHKALIGAVRRGDRVVTGGGIMGQVTKVISDMGSSNYE